MGLIAVGSIAYDSIRSPAGERVRALGGSLTHFAAAAAFLSKPKVVGVVVNGLKRFPGKRYYYGYYEKAQKL